MLILFQNFLLIADAKNKEIKPKADTEESADVAEEKEDSNSSPKTQPEKKLSPGDISKKKEIIEKILKFGSSKERKEAIREAIRFPKEASQEIHKLISGILKEDQDISVRIACLRFISELEMKSEANAVILSLRNESDDVKEAAIQAVRKLKLGEASDELAFLLKTKDFTKNQNITSLIIATLGEIPGGNKSYEFLEAKFRDKTTDSDMRAQIVLYFGKIKDMRPENYLIDAMNDEAEDVTIRCYAINSLGKMKSSKSMVPIKSLLKKVRESKNKVEIKKLSPIKIYAIGALVALGDKEVVKELFSFARDDDANVRIRAIKQLGELKEKSALELLDYKSKRDPSLKVQAAAKKAIEEINGITTDPVPKK
ncbi:MAG: HEAT repeat domain-containing protein [Leptospira sp.]|nr:HEAT repeat domain-containing protein [Leptospira sp.]